MLIRRAKMSARGVEVLAGGPPSCALCLLDTELPR